MALKGELYVAGPFGKEQIESIKAHFTELLGEEVEFDVRRNESLIGGFMAMINGKVYDSSVAFRMKEAQHSMTSNQGGSMSAEFVSEDVKATGVGTIPRDRSREIGATLKKRLSSYSVTPAVYEYGTVTSVGDGVVRIEGLSHTRYGEQISFDRDVFGMTMDLALDGVGAVLLNGQDDVRVGERV